MFFGAYLGATGLLFLVGLAVLVATADGEATDAVTRRRWRAYVVLTWFISLGCLLVFVGLSAAAGLMTFGRATTWGYPGDYLTAGPLGWGLVGLSLAGIAAPVWAALWTRRARPRRLSAPR
jgi:formate-dependent nitrite reductase membrane component NrfD